LVQDIVDMILLQQVNWDKVIHAVAQSIPGNQSVHFVNVGPGSGLMRSMENALRNGDFVTHHVGFCDTETATPQPTQDCVAIVGMAVNMPGAPNTSKLWEILEEGVNTVVKVQNIFISFLMHESLRGGSSEYRCPVAASELMIIRQARLGAP
jgi:hypothetical protein